VKLLWRGSWTDAPAYCAREPGTLVDVDVSLPLWDIPAASARPTRHPRRKLMVFLVTDGARSTFRKARTKQQEPLFSGDYRVTLALGRAAPANEPVIALAIRVPPAAQRLLVHSSLVQPVDGSFSENDLLCVAEQLLYNKAELQPLARQSYLYSQVQPPGQLLSRWQEALRLVASARIRPGLQPALANSSDSPIHPVAASSHVRLLHPPALSPAQASTLVSFEGRKQARGRPVALLGAGDYARTEIIPALRSAGFELFVVADREPQVAALAGRRYGFAHATTDPERAIRELPPPGLVVVATAHDSHAELACQAAQAGHRVFVEKPPTVTTGDVAQLASQMMARPGMIEVGYNRRYHPLVKKAHAWLRREHGPTSVTCIVKELDFHADHWYFWPNQGTRFAGNLCHWIDLAVAFLGDTALPAAITVSPRVPNRRVDDEERVLTVTFDDGSVLTVLGTTRGDDTRGVQEHIDIRKGYTTVTLDDLWKLRVRHGGVERYYRTLFRSKAHRHMYREALRRARRNEPSVYKVRDLLVVSAIQIAASDLVYDDVTSGTVPGWLLPALQAVDRKASLLDSSPWLLAAGR